MISRQKPSTTANAGPPEKCDVAVWGCVYTDEEILYGEPVANGTKVQMSTSLISKDSSIEMVYKFYRSSVGWQIYDVEIGGVSVIQTYRSQFDGVLRDGSIDDLIEKLKTDGVFDIPNPDKEGARSGSD